MVLPITIHKPTSAPQAAAVPTTTSQSTSSSTTTVYTQTRIARTEQEGRSLLDRSITIHNYGGILNVQSRHDEIRDEREERCIVKAVLSIACVACLLALFLGLAANREKHPFLSI